MNPTKPTEALFQEIFTPLPAAGKAMDPMYKPDRPPAKLLPLMAPKPAPVAPSPAPAAPSPGPAAQNQPPAAPDSGSANATPAVTAASGSIGYFDAIAADPPAVVGQTYYTRNCFKYDRGTWSTTNYWQGTLVPINTQVTLVSLGWNGMVLRLPGGETVMVANAVKHTRRNMPEIAHNLLTPQPVPIAKFDESTAAAIKHGVLKTGMTKEQVVMARGYPPAHRTASLDSDVWLYWNNRAGVQTISFSNGVVRWITGDAASAEKAEPPTTVPAPDVKPSEVAPSSKGAGAPPDRVPAAPATPSAPTPVSAATEAPSS
jgi:hypothetical protein